MTIITTIFFMLFCINFASIAVLAITYVIWKYFENLWNKIYENIVTYSYYTFASTFTFAVGYIFIAIYTKNL